MELVSGLAATRIKQRGSCRVELGRLSVSGCEDFGFGFVLYRDGCCASGMVTSQLFSGPAWQMRSPSCRRSTRDPHPRLSLAPYALLIAEFDSLPKTLTLFRKLGRNVQQLLHASSRRHIGSRLHLSNKNIYPYYM